MSLASRILSRNKFNESSSLELLNQALQDLNKDVEILNKRPKDSNLHRSILTELDRIRHAIENL